METETFAKIKTAYDLGINYINFNSGQYIVPFGPISHFENFKKLCRMFSCKDTLLDEHMTFVEDMYEKYDEPHRFFHNKTHIVELLLLIGELRKVNPGKYDINFWSDLEFVAYFHDTIYEPYRQDNELKSASIFADFINKFSKYKFNEHPEKDRLTRIVNAILDTETHKPSSEFSAVFCALDMYCITHYPMDRLYEYEHQIFKEYQCYDYSQYRMGRIMVLEHFNKQYNRQELINLIEYVKFRRPKVGIMHGSYNPWTIGHQRLKENAEKLFDKVIVARGVNPNKKGADTSYRTDLKKLMPYNQVEEYTGYVATYIQAKYNTGIDPVLINGLRDAKDFDYKSNEDVFNKMIVERKGLTEYPFVTVNLFTDKDVSHISSSAVKYLESVEKGSAEGLYYL